MVLPAQVPTDGTVSIILQPGGFPVGTQTVVTDKLLGSATATLTVSAEKIYGFGAQTGVPNLATALFQHTFLFLLLGVLQGLL